MLMQNTSCDWPLKTMSYYDGGISVVGRTINNLRYVDDTTLLGGSASELENLKSKSGE